jgi:hypothetical protein
MLCDKCIVVCCVCSVLEEVGKDGSVVVNTLCYKPEGRGCETR